MVGAVCQAASVPSIKMRVLAILSAGIDVFIEFKQPKSSPDWLCQCQKYRRLPCRSCPRVFVKSKRDGTAPIPVPLMGYGTAFARLHRILSKRCGNGNDIDRWKVILVFNSRRVRRLSKSDFGEIKLCVYPLCAL